MPRPMSGGQRGCDLRPPPAPGRSLVRRGAVSDPWPVPGYPLCHFSSVEQSPAADHEQAIGPGLCGCLRTHRPYTLEPLPGTRCYDPPGWHADQSHTPGIGQNRGLFAGNGREGAQVSRTRGAGCRLRQNHGGSRDSVKELFLRAEISPAAFGKWTLLCNERPPISYEHRVKSP